MGLPYFLIPFLLIFGSAWFSHGPDNWHSQMMLGEMAVMAYLSFEMFMRVSKLASIAFLYFSVYAVYCCFRATEFNLAAGDIQAVFDGATSRSAFFLVCAVLPFIFSKRAELRKWMVAFQAFAVADAGMMIVEFATTKHATGYIGADSIDGSFLCLMLPTFIFSDRMGKEDKGLGLGVITVAIFLAKSSTVFGLVVLQIFLMAFLNMKKTIVHFVILTVGSALVYPIGKTYLGDELLNPNGRQGIIPLSMAMFKKLGHYAFGLGNASFIVTMPYIQDRTRGFFVWMHSEPLQILFEQGITGLVLVLSLFVFIVYTNRKSKPMTILILAAGAQMLIQPSLRYFLFAIFLAFLTRLSFEEEPELLL